MARFAWLLRRAAPGGAASAQPSASHCQLSAARALRMSIPHGPGGGRARAWGALEDREELTWSGGAAWDSVRSAIWA